MATAFRFNSMCNTCMGGVIPQQALVAAIMVPGYTDTYTHSFVLLSYHEVVPTVDNASLLVLAYLL